MKFTNYLKQINSVEIYPIITLILFVALFTIMSVYVFTRDKKDLQNEANIPLND